MSRSDGTFPRVLKVKLTDADMPTDWEVSRRCVTCGKHYPDHSAFIPTPCCKATVVREGVPPDMSWKEAIYLLKERRFNEAYDEWNEGADDKQLLWEEVITDGKLDDDKVHSAIDEFIDDSLKERTSE